MQLKRSFFNPTLFGRNLSRSWPMWGGVTALGALVPLFLTLAAMNSNVQIEQEDFAELLYGAAVYFLPIFTCAYAILVAMFVWSYLHNSRSVGMMHSLAIDRTGLFVTNTLSGLAMLLIPYVVVGALLCLFAACVGALDVGAVLLTITAVLLDNLLFFGMATLCASITGSVIATAAYYVLLNFAAPVLDWLISSLAQEFVFGLTEGAGELSIWFAPVISLCEKVEVGYREIAQEHLEVPYIENFSTIVIYGIAGIAMLALSWYLYRFRRSESAGDVVAFRWLRPVFRFGIAFVSSLTLGRMLYMMFWESLFSDGSANIVPLGFWMAVSGVVGYYAASMTLEKSLRVFRGSLKGVGIVCAATVVLCFAVAVDLFGVEKYVPDAGNVASVRVSGYLDFACDAGKLPGLRDDIIALHESIIADKAYVERSAPHRYYGDSDSVSWRSISFIYTLKNGSQVERYYYIPLTEARMKDPETYDGKLYALVKSPELLVASVSVPEDAVILSAYLECYLADQDIWNSYEIDEAAWKSVYSALLQDAAEGNFAMDSGWLGDWEKGLPEEECFYGEVSLCVDYRLPADQNRDMFYEYDHLYVPLQPTMKHTLNALIATGVVDPEIAGSWKTQAE